MAAARFRLPPRSANSKTTTPEDLDGIMSWVNADDRNKEDALAPVANIDFTDRKTLMVPMKGAQRREYAFNESSYKQLCSLLGIPAKYLATCPVDGPGGQKAQVENRIEQHGGKELLVRVRNAPMDVDGKKVAGVVRAVLPGNYTPFDNRHMVTSLRSAIAQAGEFKLQASNITDPRSSEKALQIRMTREETFEIGELGLNDPHQVGFHAVTSEVGLQHLSVSALVWRLVCTNGMMGWGDSRILDTNYTNHTVSELMPRIHEAVLISMRQEEAIKDMLHRVYLEPVKDPESSIHIFARKMKLSDSLTERALYHLKMDRSAKPTKFTVLQAFTATAREAPLAERAGLEALIGKTLIGGSYTLEQNAHDEEA